MFVGGGGISLPTVKCFIKAGNRILKKEGKGVQRRTDIIVWL